MACQRSIKFTIQKDTRHPCHSPTHPPSATKFVCKYLSSNLHLGRVTKALGKQSVESKAISLYTQTCSSHPSKSRPCPQDGRYMHSGIKVHLFSINPDKSQSLIVCTFCSPPPSPKTEFQGSYQLNYQYIMELVLLMHHHHPIIIITTTNLLASAKK